MSDPLLFDAVAWEKKATAFVIRSHRHLWGKNNEDPQAFLFTRGLNNRFMKDMVLGWNKFGQNRPVQNWGLETASQPHTTLFLPSGIVIPFIVEKRLNSIFIHPYDETRDAGTTLVPGSATPTMIFGKPNEKIAVIQNIFDGLFLFQEMKDSCCVIIHPNPDLPLDNPFKSLVKNTAGVFILSSGKKETAVNKKWFPDLPDQRFYVYSSPEELKAICSIR